MRSKYRKEAKELSRLELEMDINRMAEAMDEEEPNFRGFDRETLEAMYIGFRERFHAFVNSRDQS